MWMPRLDRTNFLLEGGPGGWELASLLRKRGLGSSVDAFPYCRAHV